MSSGISGENPRWIARWSWGALVAALVLSLASSGASVFVAERPAQAAGCFAESCDGKWPGEQGCLGSKVEVTAYDFEGWWEDESHEVPLVQGRAALFYSGVCRASWAEWVVTLDYDDDVFSYPQFWAQAQYGGRRYLPKGPVDGQSEPSNISRVGDDPDIYRSAMASWNSSVQVCSIPWASYHSEPPSEPHLDDRYAVCTDWL